MPLSFPQNPQVNQVYTAGGATWTWTGVAWKRAGTTAGPQGIQGIAGIGSQGVQGLAGSTGAQGIQGLSIQGIQGISGAAGAGTSTDQVLSPFLLAGM